jgi:cell wall-associated NlpC family hydrolase
MSRPRDYFITAERVAALTVACAGWQGTPFRQRSAVRGPQGGIDCAGFLGAVFFDCGAVPIEIAVPPYALNHAQHSEESMFHAWFTSPAARTRVRLLDEDQPHLDGDIVFPKVGRCEHHAGLRIGNDIHHIARPSGYCVMRVAQMKLHRSRYRLLEAESVADLSALNSQLSVSPAP